MGNNAISLQEYDIYEVKNYRKGATWELLILRMNWHKTYRLYSYPAWRDILRGRWDKLSTSKPGPASSVQIRRLWDTRNLRRTSPSLKHSKKYCASRPTAGEKLESCLYNKIAVIPMHQQWIYCSPTKSHQNNIPPACAPQTTPLHKITS